ncbi:HipA domain-containing protein [Herbiconiux sp. UC225_62]|uniref:HipA domain-containing protein n=1 Tax=Herbiconiux sp. UC225_62 TaxID=3350168 RepID=UPI0036D2D860
MNRTLDVYLDGALTGAVTMSSGGTLTFRYADTHLDQSHPTPVSMSMPTERQEHPNRVVLPFIQGLLPDNAQALSAIATSFGVSAASPFAMIEKIGTDVAGALQFVPEGEAAPDATGARTGVRPLDETEIAELLREAIDEYSDGRPMRQRDSRFSLSGAQPKIALHALDADSWGVPVDATPTTHIFKPVTGAMRDIDVIEQITMSAARYLGLGVAESRLATFDGVRTFVTTRYDRVETGARWRRLHQEDLCQALAVPPAKKYQRTDGGPGAAAFAGLLQAIPVLDDRAAAARAFFRGFVFNVVAAGTDAHAKNYSIMLDGERVRLAPLYDLASYAAYASPGESIQLPMHVNGKYRLDAISSADLVKVGTKLRLPSSEASEIVESLRDEVVAAFSAAGDEFLAEASSSEVEGVAQRLVTGVAALPLTR